MNSILGESSTKSNAGSVLLSYPRVLSVAGSDSGGGAGIQADIKTISALGCYAATAITALTAQNTLGVQAVEPVHTAFLEKQIRSVLDDIGADSVKVGMFASLENLKIIAELLNSYGITNIVFDPVMMSSSGVSLVSTLYREKSKEGLGSISAVELIEGVTSLMRVSSLFTPNLNEVSFLLGKNVQTIEEMQLAASDLIAKGAKAVLIKGGHLLDDLGELSLSVTDVFMDKSLTPVLMQSSRILSNNLHGTGCTLSSAIASYLAQGQDLMSAVHLGRDFLLNAIDAGSMAQFKGTGPLNHGFAPLALKSSASNG